MAKGFKRKLTAILSADVEGYSRLMGEDARQARHRFCHNHKNQRGNG